MSPELLEIQPRELRFTFELKKQCSCSVQLSNSLDQYVAFKVKTTSPKKYCVRPNTGVVLPKSKFEFTVTMQAQREAPPDMQCKDKFLIQSTIVPFGTTPEDIKPTHVPKDVDVSKDVEELNLKLNELESQLNEAEKTIARLREERSTTIQEKDMLKQELALATRKSGVRRVRVGFPFLFVCFIALVSMTLGYKLRM
ncbi:vesicle-associated protein 2-2-like isoform X3 [Magnolia sinica]|uniref:vesicle-associated protein 2-2-like isoform X3 n=1 Tax=Magnolia sinica TaxID=86752 RepID=UPI002658ECD5|nr:vesicle-associated protein 2-2-like isoform X3 [Magnolia sinica]